MPISSKFNKVASATFAALLFSFPASAQKRDIRGFQPGMSAAEAIEKIRALHLVCNKMESGRGFACPGGQTGSDPRPTNFLLIYLTTASKPMRVRRVLYEFRSGRTKEELTQDVATQFGGTLLAPSSVEGMDAETRGVGGGYVLKFGYAFAEGMYLLELSDPSVEVAEADAIEAERRRANPPPKF